MQTIQYNPGARAANTATNAAGSPIVASGSNSGGRRPSYQMFNPHYSRGGMYAAGGARYGQAPTHAQHVADSIARVRAAIAREGWSHRGTPAPGIGAIRFDVRGKPAPGVGKNPTYVKEPTYITPGKPLPPLIKPLPSIFAQRATRGGYALNGIDDIEYETARWLFPALVIGGALLLMKGR